MYCRYCSKQVFPHKYHKKVIVRDICGLCLRAFRKELEQMIRETRKYRYGIEYPELYDVVKAKNGRPLGS